MKHLFTLILPFFYLSFTAQIFNGTGGNILNNGGQETVFNLVVAGLPASIDSTFGLEEVCVNINHNAVQELKLTLMSPSGIEVDLSGVLSCSGVTFSNTCFNNNVFNSVTTASAPYTGTFRPVGNMGRFNTSKPGNGTWKLMVKDFVAPANSGMLVGWSLKFGNNPAKPVMLNSSNLPLVFLNTNSQALSVNDIIVDLGIVYNGTNRNSITDPKNNYNGKALCHIRGSSSKMFEKNNIKIELKDASGVNDVEASLLGMPAESDWVLTSCYSDKSLVRNSLTQHLFSQMGHYSPRTHFVELFLNGEYFGVYMLMEQVKRGNNRVSISKVTPIDNQFPYITGGYIIQINRTDDPGWYSMYPGISGASTKFYYQYNYPQFDEISPQQQGYIKSVLDSFETVMNSPTYTDPVTGYKKFINDDSFLDYLIINELSKNPDAYRLSTYLYKDNIMDGGKIHVGPVWDYDLAWHNCNYGNAWDEKYWQFEIPNNDFPIPVWWDKLMDDINFKNKLYCRYHSLRMSLLSNNKLYEYIDNTAAMLSESQQRNFRQFPIIGAYVYANPQNQTGATYQTEVQDLKNWIYNRTAWLDANIPGFCANVGIAETEAKESVLNVFPNPFSDDLSIVVNAGSKPCSLSIEVYNILGEKITMLNEKEKIMGEYKTTIVTRNLKSGTYFVKASLDDKIYYKKVIRL
jgi:subtilisin-like proprotein convertase family protein